MWVISESEIINKYLVSGESYLVKKIRSQDSGARIQNIITVERVEYKRYSNEYGLIVSSL